MSVVYISNNTLGSSWNRDSWTANQQVGHSILELHAFLFGSESSIYTHAKSAMTQPGRLEKYVHQTFPIGLMHKPTVAALKLTGAKKKSGGRKHFFKQGIK